MFFFDNTAERTVESSAGEAILYIWQPDHLLEFDHRFLWIEATHTFKKSQVLRTRRRFGSLWFSSNLEFRALENGIYLYSELGPNKLPWKCEIFVKTINVRLCCVTWREQHGMSPLLLPLRTIIQISLQDHLERSLASLCERITSISHNKNIA